MCRERYVERTQEHPYPPQAHQPPSTFVYLPTQKLYEPCTFRIFFLNTTYAFILFYYFILLFLLLFKYICLHFPPHLSSTPTSHPQSYPLLALSMGPLYIFLDDLSPSSPLYFEISFNLSSLTHELLQIILFNVVFLLLISSFILL